MNVFAQSPLTLSSFTFALVGLVGFIAALFVGARWLPGRMVQGFALADGARQRYRINGISLWVLTHMVVIAGTLHCGLTLTPLLEHFWALFVAANVVSIAASVWLWARAPQPEDEAPTLAGHLRSFWLGRELNPRLAGVDLKTFAYQPSLIGLWLFVLAFGYAQYETLGTLTPQMLLFQVFWWLYLTTHYVFEDGILSMWDVIAERFGFMLVWGDLAVVPFFYAIGGWALIALVEPMSPIRALAIATLFFVGLWIFRESNAQKHRFKRNRDTTIWGERPRLVGGRLLISGWWGIGRKLNYTGEICVYLGIALTAGAVSWVPYAVVIWLCLLLPQRAYRDELRCRAKYGPLWDEYCRHARFRMIPFIY